MKAHFIIKTDALLKTLHQPSTVHRCVINTAVFVCSPTYSSGCSLWFLKRTMFHNTVVASDEMLPFEPDEQHLALSPTLDLITHCRERPSK